MRCSSYLYACPFPLFILTYNVWIIFSLQTSTPHPPHRYDLSTDSDGFMSGVAEIISINGDGLSLPFVSPSCIVPKHNTAGLCACTISVLTRKIFPFQRFEAELLHFTYALPMRLHLRARLKHYRILPRLRQLKTSVKIYMAVLHQGCTVTFLWKQRQTVKLQNAIKLCAACLLPETFNHIGQIHGVRNNIWLPVVKGLQLLWQQHNFTSITILYSTETI